MQGSHLAILFALLSGLAFSLVTPFTRVIIDNGAVAPTVIALRYIIMVLGTGLLIVVLGRPWRIRASPVAFTMTAAGWLAISAGHLGAVQFIPVSLSAIIFYTFPLMLLFWRRVRHGQKFTPLTTGVFLLAFAGVVIAIGPSLESLDPRGIALALLGAVGSATLMLGNEAMPKENDPFALAFWLTVSNLPIALLWAIGFNTWSPPTGADWIPMTIIGLSTVAGMALIVLAIRHGGSALTGLLMNIEPVSIVLLSVIVLGEKLPGTKVVGIGLVILALIVATWPRGAAKDSEPRPDP